MRAHFLPGRMYVDTHHVLTSPFYKHIQILCRRSILLHHIVPLQLLQIVFQLLHFFFGRGEGDTMPFFSSRRRRHRAWSDVEETKGPECMCEWGAWAWGEGVVVYAARKSKFIFNRIKKKRRKPKVKIVTLKAKAEGKDIAAIADWGKRVLLSHLFDFVCGDFRVQRFKLSTHMSPKSKSKRWERRTRLQQSVMKKSPHVPL